MLARDETNVVSPVKKEAESPTREAVSPTSLRLSAPSWDNVAATSVGEEDEEPPYRDASPGLGSAPGGD